MTYTYYTTN